MLGQGLFRSPDDKHGFTIVELLIVIVVIGILAAITIVSFNGVTARAAAAKKQSDIAMYYQAIVAARANTGQTLLQITGSSWSIGGCSPSPGNNTSNTEPKDLPTTHACWTKYYNDLTTIGNAANMNLSGLRAGDPNGNPYGLDANEGEVAGQCNQDRMYTFNHDGTAAMTQVMAIPTANC
jgi:prepilin-type N-terminal cleavage/methylation domain-containing protein